MLPTRWGSVRAISLYENRSSILLVGEDAGRRGLEIVRPTTVGVRAGSIKQTIAGVSSASAQSTGVDIQVVDDRISSEKLFKKYLEDNQYILTASDIYCIYGMIRLTESYYLICVTKAEVEAIIHGHYIYKILDTITISVTYRVRYTMEETKYKSILSNVDFSSGFYFSYTYDLTNSLQEQTKQSLMNAESKGSSLKLQDMYIWNYFALEPILRLQNQCNGGDKWIVPIIYGYLCQKSVQLYDHRNHKIVYTLIGRRSRHFAGTRYLRRGVNYDGYVANEVETEQIVTREIYGLGVLNNFRSSSLVQLRGSIPLYWSHTNTLSPQPGIVLENEDPSHEATIKHFQQLMKRYGEHIAILNLVRKKDSGREVLVGTAYTDVCAKLSQLGNQKTRDNDSDSDSDAESVDSIGIDRETLGANSSVKLPLYYRSFDFLGNKHHDSNSLFASLVCIGEETFPNSGFFVQPHPMSPDNSYISFPLPASFAMDDDVVNALFSNDSGYFDTYSKNISQFVEDYFTNEDEGVDMDTSSVFTDATNFNASNTGLQLHINENYINDKIDNTTTSKSAYESADINQTTKNDKEQVDCSGGTGLVHGLLQRGVLRTNCIDCLDRTNVGQFCYAKTVLIKQLRALGVELSPKSLNDLLTLCMESWAKHGDEMAKQYGGSGAMHRLDEKSDSNLSFSSMMGAASMGMSSNNPNNSSNKEFILAEGAQNAFVAVQRYYSNVSLDTERQQSIDLMLGVFTPAQNEPPLWELDLQPSAMRMAPVVYIYDNQNIPTVNITSNNNQETLDSEDVNSDYIGIKYDILPHNNTQIFFDETFTTSDLVSFDQVSDFKCSKPAIVGAMYIPYPYHSKLQHEVPPSLPIVDERIAAYCDDDSIQYEVLNYDEKFYNDYVNRSPAKDILGDNNIFYYYNDVYSHIPLPFARPSGSCDVSKSVPSTGNDTSSDTAIDSSSDEVSSPAIPLDEVNTKWLETTQEGTLSTFPVFGKRDGKRVTKYQSADDEDVSVHDAEVSNNSSAYIANLDPMKWLRWG